MTATVVGVEGGVYTLALDDGRRVEGKLRGRLKQREGGADKIVIGDRVEVLESDGAVTVETPLPRRSVMVRRGASGRKPKVLAANLDRVFIVVAVEPAPHAQLLDRLFVVAEASGIPPVLVINKVDLPGGSAVVEPLAARYAAVGYPVLPVSARTGAGIDTLAHLLCSGTSALIGPSGVGKSTLLNRVEPGLRLRTGDLSGRTRTGRHTTVSARLLDLACGGAVADTPGFSDVGLWEMDPAALDDCFPELRSLKGSCRFRGCAHAHEPGCAVRDAVTEGSVAVERFDSYLALREEAVAAAAKRVGR